MILQPYIGHVLAFLRTQLRRLLSLLRICPLSLQAPRPGDKTLHAAWLTFNMRKAGLLSATSSVASAVIAPVDANRGLSGRTFRVLITYTAGSEGPASLILKMSGNSVHDRKSIISMGHRREALFYGSVLSRSAEAIARVVHTHGSNLFGEFSLLVEDVTVTHKVTPVNFVFGNQIWGAPTVDADPVETLKKMYLTAADLHAAYWNDASIVKTTWLKCSDWYRGEGEALWTEAMDQSRARWQKALTKPIAASFSPKLVKIITDSLALASWPALQKQIRSAPFTLCHGDFHASNMFLREDGAIVMFDWSEVGPFEPTSTSFFYCIISIITRVPADLAQTLISDVKPAIFREHSRALVRAYWERLVSKGVSAEAYPFETCWEGFCGGVERWLWMLPLLAVWPGLPDKAVMYFHDQVLAFIEAHGDRPVYALKSAVLI